MVTLRIDGTEVTAEPGTTVLAAAQQNGVGIPTLCYDKRLPPYGGCGLCMVEVTFRGKAFTLPACTTLADDGMEVATHTAALIEGRRKQLMLLLRTHPLSCPTCDAAGDCRLQQLVHEYAIPELVFRRKTRDHYVDDRSHLIRFDMNVCIKCGLCVRICDQIQGEGRLSLTNRGIKSEVATSFRRPLNCEFCGQCAQICPVGAISSKWLVGTGRRFELDKTQTVCPFCSLGCTLTLNHKGGSIVEVTSPFESPNEGNLCVKGRYGWTYVYSEHRLARPLIRKSTELEEVEWDEALGFVADRFRTIKEASKPTALAALGSARITNEEAYVFNRFVRTVLETPHLDHAGGYAYRALVDGLGQILPYPAGANSIREIRNSDVILLLGADLNETHPGAKNEVILATGPGRKGTVVVVDSIRTKLCGRRGIQLLTPPGMEHLIVYAMLRVIIHEGFRERKAIDLAYGGLEDLVASLEPYTLDRVAKLTGTDSETIRQAACMYAEAPTATIILTAGMNKRGNHVALAQAAVNLALVTDRIGKEGCGIHLFGEKANSQGMIDMGLLPDRLPGFLNVLDDETRKKFESAWGSPLPKEKGLDAGRILEEAANGQIRGLYVVGENLLDTYPDRKVTEKALRTLELLVVQDMFLTSTAKMAHAVLPVASFAEKTGTYTSAERRVQLLQPIRDLPVSKSDLDIFQALAARMGKSSITYTGPEQVMEEIATLVDVYKGISHARLRDGGIQWPCTNQGHPGTEFLYKGGFPKKKVKLIPAPAFQEPLMNGFPFWVVPEIVKFHSGSLSQWSSSLTKMSPEVSAEMNPKDMQAIGLEDGDSARIICSSGDSITINVKKSRRAIKGSVLIPRHFSPPELTKILKWDEDGLNARIERVENS